MTGKVQHTTVYADSGGLTSNIRHSLEQQSQCLVDLIRGMSWEYFLWEEEV